MFYSWLGAVQEEHGLVWGGMMDPEGYQLTTLLLYQICTKMYCMVSFINFPKPSPKYSQHCSLLPHLGLASLSALKWYICPSQL